MAHMKKFADGFGIKLGIWKHGSIKVKNARLAIGRGMAQKIIVEWFFLRTVVLDKKRSCLYDQRAVFP